MTEMPEDVGAERRRRSRRQVAAALLLCGLCVLSGVSALIPHAAEAWGCLFVLAAASAAVVTVRNWIDLSFEWRAAGLWPWLFLTFGMTAVGVLVLF